MTTMTEKEFKQLANYIEENFGIRLKDEKKTLVKGRLNRVLLENNLKSFSEYFDYVITDKTGDAITNLINNITTNHTFFMRERDHFDYFKNKVLPYLMTTVKDGDLRIWSAGCSSGEEPYTLAMILKDFVRKEKVFWNTKVLATDISSKVLEKAAKGEYTNEQIAPLPLNWKLDYLKKINNENSIIVDDIKNEVIYRKFNLMDDIFPFKKKFHVIFCRNVMIYFDGKTKDKLINKFYKYTEQGCYLFVGHSESLNRENTQYKYVMPSVYRKE